MLFTLMLRGKQCAVFCDSTTYDRPNTFWKSAAKRFFFTRCNGFFGYGIRSREYLMLHGADSRRIFYRCQAAALPADYNPEQALQTRLANAPPPQAPARFLYVGRLSQEKGLDTLIFALAKLRKTIPTAEVALVGAGPLKESLEALAKQNGIGDAVHFLGSMGIEKLALEYAKASALVLPSTSEPWGLVVNEALSYGCPVVVSKICGCVPELVLDRRSGFSFQTNSVDSLVQALRDTLDHLADVPATAEFCIELMKEYSPQNAAQQILEGCRKILMLKESA
jgi:glycosyltransferase involved in cell wall biosynthesis